MSGLIEGLPDDISLRCLAFIPYYLHRKLELVSRSWKAAIRSAELFRVRQEVGLSEDFLCVCCHDPNNTWQLYDPLQNLWFTLPELPSKRRHLANFGAVSTSQKLFVLGGHSDGVDPVTGERDGNFSTNEVWSFDPVTQSWSMRAPMLVPRALFACCVVDGKIVVAGGFTSISKPTSKAEMYDPEKDVWIPLPDLLNSQSTACTGVVIGGKMHIVHNRKPPRVEVFNSLELKWRAEDYRWLREPMAVVQDSLYVMRVGYGHIFKQDERDRQVIISITQFIRRMGMAMVGFRDKLYVIGGTFWSVDERGLVKLSDVHVLNLRDEKLTWNCAAPMSRCRGTVLGCTELRI